MRVPVALFAALLLIGCSQPPSSAETHLAPSADATKTPATVPPPIAGGPSQMATETAAPGRTASALGTVVLVDVNAGKITISHGPVDALKWPAMTMAFNATPEQLASVRVGQKVQFEFFSKDMDATLTGIAAIK